MAGGRMRQRWYTFGASVRGPAHVQEGLPNQDAWAAWHGSAGSALVVCDGLGSRPHADVGARAACRAVTRAVRRWATAPDAPSDVRLALVHALWRLEVSAYGPGACATTCLLAYADARGELFLAQLGDGLVAALVPGSPLLRIEPEDHGFSNVTSALGVPGAFQEWRTMRVQAPPGTRVLLASDGVADDLDPNRVDDFVCYVHDTYATVPTRYRSPRCASELRHWPVPRHTDDKTLALLWSAAPAHA